MTFSALPICYATASNSVFWSFGPEPHEAFFGLDMYMCCTFFYVQHVGSAPVGGQSEWCEATILEPTALRKTLTHFCSPLRWGFCH